MKRLSEFIRKKTGICLVILLGILFVSIILCVGLGPVNIPFKTVWNVIFHRLFHWGDVSRIPENVQNIVWFLRVPRVLLGTMVGICLTLSGVAMQAFTKNPLADPYVLGISSGASFGAVLAIATTSITFLGKYSVQFGAFAGALVAIMLVYLLSKSGRDVTPIKLILVGVAISAMFSAFTNLVVYKAPDEAKVGQVVFWMLGGVAGVEWKELLPVFAIFIPGSIALYCLAQPLNAMMMGDGTATTLGVNVNRIRKITILISALLTAAAVSVAGCIGFVGLVIPHVVRSMVGADHKKVIPLATFMGAIFLIWIDVGARILDAPGEMPVGILTALLGAPFFLWMIKIRKYEFGEKG